MLSDFTYYMKEVWTIGIVRFIVFLLLAFVVAAIVSKLVAKLLKLIKLDEKFKKWGIAEGTAGTSVKFIEKLVYLVIFLCFIPSALEAIGIGSVANPIHSFVSTFISYIPNIVVAVILVYVGILVTNLVCSLLTNVLTAIKLDDAFKKALPKTKVSATKTVVDIVRVFILLFVAAQSIQVLNLSFLSSIVSSIVAYLPTLIKAALILLAATIGANWAEAAVSKSCAKGGKIVKIAIFVVAAFMILSQLGISAKIVETTFIYAVGALAVAFALAFGLGGKDYAKKLLEKLDKDEK